VEKEGKLLRRALKLRTMLMFALLALIGAFVAPHSAEAQRRGQYTPGINSTNSGVLPEPGITYANVFQLYSFDTLKGPDGEDLPVNSDLSVFIDHNIFIWVSKKKILGAKFAMLADLPIANNSLSLAEIGTVGGGGGFADSYYQPFTLGWNLKHADIQAAYGFVAPTGRFTGGATDNVGTGYWGHNISSGQTFYLTKNRGTAVSAYEQYEFHSTQRDTDIHPGQTFNIDYSLTQVIPLQKNMHTLLQVGLIGYGQYQTTDRSGPGINPVLAANGHYRVNALGAAANIILPVRKANLGFKWLKEFSNKSTVEGQTIQISGAITF
jgi:hypothetical protein